MKNKGAMSGWQMFGGFALIILLIFGGLFFVMGSTFPGEDGGEGEGAYDYSGTKLDYGVETYDASGDSVTSGDLYIFEEKPSNWESERSIQTSDADRTVSIDDDGETEFRLLPGTYYVVAENSDYYMEFFKIEVPSSGDVAPSDLSRTWVDDVELVEPFSPSTSNIDLGVDENSTDTQTFSEYENYQVGEDEEYRLWKGFLEITDSNYDFTGDDDGDGVYDEGISSLTVDVAGVEETVWEPDSAIDKLGADANYNIIVEETIEGDEDFTVEAEAVADETTTVSEEGDEKLGDGDPLIDIILVDEASTTASSSTVEG